MSSSLSLRSCPRILRATTILGLAVGAIAPRGAGAATALATATGWTQYDRPAQYGIRTETTFITMSDGVRLWANVRRPAASGRFPVLVTLTPYNGSNGVVAANDDYLVQRGYVQLVVDVRGTGSSEGTWDNFSEREQRDGYEVVEWAAKQPWSDGKVGMWGESYMAISQLFTAAQHPPHLKALFPIVPMADSYRDMVFPGGQENTGFIPFWLVLVSGSGLVPPPYALDGSADHLTQAATELLTHAAGYASFDTTSVVQATAGDRRFDGPSWKLTSPIEIVDKVKVPTFIVGGEHDIFQRGEPLLYERLKNRVPTRLLIGPWTHTHVGEGLPADGVPDLDHIALRWFDHWLKGMNTNVDAIPKVTQYDLPAGPWVTQSDWPNPALAPSRLYLHAGRALSTAPPTAADAGPSVDLAGLASSTCSTAGSTVGTLPPLPPLPAPPASPGGVLGTACTTVGGVATTLQDVIDSLLPSSLDVFPQNPVSGVCTQSTSQWSAGLLAPVPCTTDNRLDEATSGVAYTTAPLQHDLELSGPLFADVWVKTTARDAVVSVRVTDVSPDGTSTELTDGWLAASFRALDPSRSRFVGGQLLQPWHPFTQDSVLPVTPNEPVELPIEIFPTNAVIHAGDSLRLDVGPNDFPHAVPPVDQTANSLAGLVQVLHDPQHQSYLALPTLGACPARGCEPLPVANLIRG